MPKITQKKKELKKINEILPAITHINVIDDVFTEVTQEADPKDEWSVDSTAEYHRIRGIRINPRYGDVECSFEVLPETNYYLLYYLQDAGDSFGSYTGNIEFVALYNDKQLADKSCQALNQAGNAKKESAIIWDDLGKPYEEHILQDYFGGFTGAYVTTVQLI